MFSDRFNTIFIHIPKTAGQSIERVFLKEHGLKWKQRQELLLGMNRDRSKGPPRLAHLYASEYPGAFVSPGVWASAFKFTVVRNPYKRALSEYRYRKRPGPKTYREFVTELLDSETDRHLVPQARFVFDARGKALTDTIIRFESLAADFAAVAGKVFGREVKLPHVNSAAAPMPPDADSSELRRIIYKRYQEDFEAFGYPRDP